MEFPADRWIESERLALEDMRNRCSAQLALQSPFPEVVGDRRLLRFLRGRQGNVKEATDQYLGHLKFRRERGVDEFRQNIVYGGMNNPNRFPNGEKILSLAPQIVCAPVKDNKGQPICTEQYNFSPKRLFQESSTEEYICFLTYALEFRMLIMEQLSHEEDLKYLQAHPDPADRVEGWGSIVRNCTIRDLASFGFEHCAADGRAFIKTAISVGSPNYPESLGKAHMINTPWVFNNLLWPVLKQVLDPNTLDKFAILGRDYMRQLEVEIPMSSIPVDFGGTYPREKYNETVEFDYNRNGPIWYEGCPDPPAPPLPPPLPRNSSETFLDMMMSGSEKVRKSVTSAFGHAGSMARRGSFSTSEITANNSNSNSNSSSGGGGGGSGSSSSSEPRRRSSGNANVSRPSLDARPSLVAAMARGSPASSPAPIDAESDGADADDFSADPFYSPRRVKRSLSQVGSHVLRSSQVVVRREVIEPVAALGSTHPLLLVASVVFVAHVMSKLDIHFLRYFVIPLVILSIDMTIGLRW